MAKDEMNFKTTAEIKLSSVMIDHVIGQDEAVKVVKKAAAQRRHVLLIGEPGTGKCVGKDTLISFDKGVLSAEELFKMLEQGASNVYLYSIDEEGKATKSRAVRAYKGEKKTCLKLRTKSGSEVVLSGVHPLLTLVDGNICFSPASELKAGSWVGKARILPAENKANIGLKQKVQHIGRNGVKSLILIVPDIITKDLAYFLGLYAAEGYYDGTIKIYNSDKNVKESAKKAIISSFDYPPDYFYETKTGIRVKKSRTLAKILSEQFNVNLTRKKQSSNKQVPQKIFSSTQKVIASYLSGYLDGDGHIGSRGLEFATASRKLAIGLQTLLLKLGITSRFRVVSKCATNTVTKTKREYFMVNIYDSENLQKLASHLDLKIEYKKKALEKFSGIYHNTNVDVIPGINQLLMRPKGLMGMSFEDLGILHPTFTKLRKEIRLPSRNLVRKLFTLYDEHIPVFLEQNSAEAGNGLVCLQQESKGKLEEVESAMQKLCILANSDIIWDKIVSIGHIVEDVYDFEVERCHNFIVDSGLVVHNSMLGMALAELLPKEKLVDVVAFPNPNDENQPLIRTLPAGEARDLINRARIEGMNSFKGINLIMMVLLIASFIAPIFAFNHYSAVGGPILGGIMFFAFMIGFLILLIAFVLFINMNRRTDNRLKTPKLVVDNYKRKTAPFHDATGAHAGALLGDVLHDPFQSGGLGTPAHERIVAGMIHKANMGVLFVDEIATLQPATQQELLTALQEGKYAITGQSERSAGAMVRTEPVPCNFILVAAGNFETIKHMHPALRSRIRGYGYEIYMKETMPDTPENRLKIAKLVAQEVTKDKKIPHFSMDAIEEITTEARRAANRKGHLTLRLRELGGLVRAAGDVAVEENAKLVTKEHIVRAKAIARTLEQQIADKYIEQKKEYEIIITEGLKVGRVNGLAVIGSGGAYSGIILPIEAEVTFGGKESQIMATGKLGKIAKEAIINVSAIVKKYFGEDIKEKHDIYVQFLQTYEGVEGDSASIAVATAIISALKGIPIKQEYAMTGSLSVRGEVLPVGGVSAKVEAALDAGIKKVLVPKTNLKDIIIDKAKLGKIQIIPVENIAEVLKEALHWKGNEKVLARIAGA